MAKSEILLKIAEIIRDTIGLNFSANRLNDLEKGIIASAKDLGKKSDIDGIFSWISTAALSTEEIRIISSHLTVGETYFFREKTSLDLFVKVIIPEFVSKRRGNTRHLRIWCAGCSSGEEPYSLAILIKENFPELSGWNISILATDINPKALNKAIAGEYSEWSFRESDPKMRNKYFTKKGNQWLISPEIKGMVDFSFLNLSGNHYPSSTTDTENIDIVFCRNVFIYLSQRIIPEVAERIFKSLVDGGWLITSQVELNDDYFALFGKYFYENNFFYLKGPGNSITKSKTGEQRKSDDKMSASAYKTTPNNKATVNHKIATNHKTAATHKKDNIALKRMVLPPRVTLSAVEHDNKKKFQEAKALADKGEYEKATEFINTIITSGKADADIYYLYGTLFYEQDKHEEAKDALRKTLYLNPRHLLSNMILGNILRQGENNDSARIYYKNALEILNEWKEDEVVPGSGGMTKGRIRSMLEKLISEG